MNTKYEITRRLVEEVMGIEPMNSVDFNIMEDTILYKDKKKKSISINDFFFKCQKWGWNLTPKYTLLSSYRNCMLYKQGDGTMFDFIKSFDDISQQQAVFDACQWILENKEIKCMK